MQHGGIGPVVLGADFGVAVRPTIFDVRNFERTCDAYVRQLLRESLVNPTCRLVRARRTALQPTDTDELVVLTRARKAAVLQLVARSRARWRHTARTTGCRGRNPGSLRWARASANVSRSQCLLSHAVTGVRESFLPCLVSESWDRRANCSSGCSGEQVSGGSPCDCARISCPCGWQITYDPERPSTAWRVPARTRAATCSRGKQAVSNQSVYARPALAPDQPVSANRRNRPLRTATTSRRSTWRP